MKLNVIRFFQLCNCFNTVVCVARTNLMNFKNDWKLKQIEATIGNWSVKYLTELNKPLPFFFFFFCLEAVHVHNFFNKIPSPFHAEHIHWTHYHFVHICFFNFSLLVKVKILNSEKLSTHTFPLPFPQTTTIRNFNLDLPKCHWG